MRRVIIESPFAASNGYSVEENLAYLRAAMRDCLKRGEAPFASHGLYTQPGVLDDDVGIGPCPGTRDKLMNERDQMTIERDQLIALTETMAEQPDDYDGPCLCQECKSCN